MFLYDLLLSLGKDVSIKAIAHLAIGITIVYSLSTLIYNAYFHPLSHVPGPWLARASYLPEFWYDVVRSGQYTKQIQKMHERYGPLVRVNPGEVHCADHRFIDQIYASGAKKRDKPQHQVNGVGGISHATFATTSHEMHRMRRGALNKFFSKAQVARLEPIIRDLAEKLCDKILAVKKNEPFDLTTAYSMFSTDVISGYCLGENLGLIAQNGWTQNFREPLYAQLRLMYYFRFIPGFKYLLGFMTTFTKHIDSEMDAAFNALIVDMPNYIKKAQTSVEKGVDNGTTVFGALLQSGLPQSEKSLERMTEEGFSLFAAGTETISWTLAVITYYLGQKPDQLQRITEEVAAAVDDTGKLPNWAALEKLPYLGAVIQEGLRLSYCVASRTSRIAPEENLVFQGEYMLPGSSAVKTYEYMIPRGYAVGMSSVITHHDESIYPDSHSFLPERWLDEKNERRKDLDRVLLSFSKGSRSCIGINLAYCELHLLLALLVLRVFPHLHLYETTAQDVVYDHDYFNPFPEWTSQGIRAVVN